MPIQKPCTVPGCKRYENIELAPEFAPTKELGAWYKCSCPVHGFDGYVNQRDWTFYVRTQEAEEQKRLKKKAGK